MRTIIFILILLATASISNAAIAWEIYSDTTISSGSYSNVNIFDSLDVPPVQTEVDMIGGDIEFLHSRDTSIVNVFGGSVNTITAYDSSTVNITGGSIVILDAPGPDAYFHIYGYGFSIETPSSTYTLTGFWEDNSGFEILLRRAATYEGHYVLHEIPEPASFLLLAFGYLLFKNRC